MNEQPPDRDQPDDVDEFYRRASELDTSRPSEAVRRAVLAHATRLGAERTAAKAPGRMRSHRPVIFGTLAAAALAGLLVLPRLLAPSAPRESGAPAGQARQDLVAEPAPRSERASEADSSNSGEAALTPPPPALAPPKALQPVPPPEVPPPPQEMPAPQEAPAAPQAYPSHPAQEAVQEEERKSAPASPMPAEARLAAPSARMGALLDRTEPPTAALRRAAEAGDLPRLKTLLDTQTDVDSRDDRGRTALMLAILHGHGDVVGLLLERGADPNAADVNGTTPLQAATAQEEPAIVAALRRKGAR